MDLGLLLLRVVVGTVMAAHGAQKLFGWFGGHGLQGTGGWLESLGFRPGMAHARINGLSELAGGVLLAVGLLTPFGAAAIIGVMFVAIATVHWNNGFFNTAGGYEFNLVLIAAATSLAVAGPGRFSLDSALGMTVNGFAGGLLALGLSAIAAGLSLSMRRPVPAPQEAPAAEAASADRIIDLKDRERSSVDR